MEGKDAELTWDMLSLRTCENRRWSCLVRAMTWLKVGAICRQTLEAPGVDEPSKQSVGRWAVESWRTLKG